MLIDINVYTKISSFIVVLTRLKIKPNINININLFLLLQSRNFQIWSYLSAHRRQDNSVPEARPGRGHYERPAAIRAPIVHSVSGEPKIFLTISQFIEICLSFYLN